MHGSEANITLSAADNGGNAIITASNGSDITMALASLTGVSAADLTSDDLVYTVAVA